MAAPIITPTSPADGQTDTAADAPLAFMSTDPVVAITVNGVPAYADGGEQNGYTVLEDGEAPALAYTVTAPAPWRYGVTVNVNVSAATLGEEYIEVTYSWSFTVEDNPSRFTGPLTALEDTLFVPFSAGSPALEGLRALLLANVNTRRDPVTSARTVFLAAHARELAPLLHQYITAPTVAQRAVKLCYKATDLAVSSALRQHAYFIVDAIGELKTLGITTDQADMLYTYANDEQPYTEVHLACVLVLLAKVLV